MIETLNKINGILSYIKATVSRVSVCLSVCLCVCMSQLIGTRERKKQKIQINKISPYKYNVRYVRYVPVRYVNGILAFFRKNSYVRTDLHTSIKLFVVPRESTDF